MDNNKILQPFQSETFNNIKTEYNKLLNMLSTYLVLADPFKNQLNIVQSLLENANQDYNKELEQFVDNPQNICKHEHEQHKYLRDNIYEVICKDCGQKLGVYRLL